MQYRKILVCLAILPFTAAFAQTKTASSTSSAPISVFMGLSQAKTFAESEVARLEKELSSTANEIHLVPCDFYEKKIQLEYNRWFLEPSHYGTLQRKYAELDEAIASVNAKLASLENGAVNVLVQRGQGNQTEVPVAFQDLVSFFRIYDQRMKTCPKDQKAALMDIMESEPVTNPLHIVLSQVRAAGGMMSVNLNASLQEQSATYELLMTPKERGYRLEIQVTTDEQETYRFSLLDESASKNRLELNEQQKWTMLTQGKLDGMSIDGGLRYRKIQNEFRGKCATLPRLLSRRLGSPYVSYPAAVEISKNERVSEDGILRNSDFVTIEPGIFQMRFDASEQHQVTLTQEFEIQATEVTQAQWHEVMKTNPSHFRRRSDCSKDWAKTEDKNGMCSNHPVESVNWEDTQRFIQELNARNDLYIYRLPTEAEWEYAAGKERQAAWMRENSGDHPHAVATAGAGIQAANSNGLYDVFGNVAEWVQDRYGYLNQTAAVDPMGPTTGSERVYCGGDFNTYAAYMPASVRNRGSSQDRYSNYGFRLVRTLR